jgi:hypothetical protein
MQNDKKYWNKWYGLVLLLLLVQIIMYWLITLHYQSKP